MIPTRLSQERRTSRPQSLRPASAFTVLSVRCATRRRSLQYLDTTGLFKRCGETHKELGVFNLALRLQTSCESRVPYLSSPVILTFFQFGCQYSPDSLSRSIFRKLASPA